MALVAWRLRHVWKVNVWKLGDEWLWMGKRENSKLKQRWPTKSLKPPSYKWKLESKPSPPPLHNPCTSKKPKNCQVSLYITTNVISFPDYKSKVVFALLYLSWPIKPMSPPADDQSLQQTSGEFQSQAGCQLKQIKSVSNYTHTSTIPGGGRPCSGKA
ncbi:uncharacterized protein VP01_531g8 [Puccinia sorghi]|uniref:Uncharacterized protein n=1 Tax=Puccinia sorghi TaxID=27349 RepID=A0A0L6UKZ7_9BASI|nr:uncharacterized protein VP01_531g8 [Puccinia sorghi]